MCQTVYLLSAYGDLSTLAGAQAAFATALNIAQSCGGGVIEIPTETNAQFQVNQSFDLVTIIDVRSGIGRLQLPLTNSPISGSGNYPAGSSLVRRSHTEIPQNLYGDNYAQVLLQRNIHGSSSIRTQLLDMDGSGIVVHKGQDAQWFPSSIEGIFVGQRFNVNDESTVYIVKSIAWSNILHCPYFLSDATDDINAPAIISNKNDIGVLYTISEDHCTNQSSALTIDKYVYSQGDAFVSQGSLLYQSDIMSSEGDEGGVVYTSEIVQDLRTFRAIVQTFDPASKLLTYRLDAAHAPINTERLSNARPVVNLNTTKWITSGAARIYISTTYPNSNLKLTDGVVQGIDTAWGQEVVGRYFAVDEPSEYLDPSEGSFNYVAPIARLHRWFRIMKIMTDPDNGSQLLFVRVIRWSTSFGSPQLADVSNYFNYSGKEVKYIIAPGAIVSDVTSGVNENDSTLIQNKLILQPNGDFGTTGYPFAPGDPIEQALGPQPWNPSGFRVRHFNNFPSLIEDSSFITYNWGSAPVNSALALVGASDLAGAATQYRHGDAVAFEVGIAFNAVVLTGINFAAEMRYLPPGSFLFLGVGDGQPDAGLAILFQQTDANRKVIGWSTADASTVATLGFDPDQQTYYIRGGSAVNFTSASLNEVRGLSASDIPSQNLRGINIPVPEGMEFLDVLFSNAEADTTYGIQITPAWISACAVTNKTKQGFRVLFGAPPTQPTTLDWLLVR